MATSSKNLISALVHKTGINNGLLALGNNFRCHVSVIHCSTSTEPQELRVSKGVKAYLRRIREYDDFLKEQLNEYNTGKKFLATMMGKKGEMTQEDIDAAIEYLFPSGLFVPSARPLMKPPEALFSKRKPIQLDDAGRPFHFLFYTGRPNYTQILHDAATHLQKLNDYHNKISRKGKEEPLKKLVLVGNWISKEDLESKLIEKIYTIEYTKFIEVLNRLSEHPCASMVEDFIREFWIGAKVHKESELPEVITKKDGTQFVRILAARRKTSSANVKLIYPGLGRILINNQGLDYFLSMQSREQVNIAFSHSAPLRPHGTRN